MTVVTAPVRKELSLNCSPEHAFRVFTEQIDTWWPLADYSINGDKARTCVFEARAGGRIYEIAEDGTEADWGRVTVCEPPNRLVYDWSPSSKKPTEVEVRFVALPDGTTKMTLEHRHWERLGEAAAAWRESYNGGWVRVLGAYESAVS